MNVLFDSALVWLSYFKQQYVVSENNYFCLGEFSASLTGCFSFQWDTYKSNNERFLPPEKTTTANFFTHMATEATKCEGECLQSVAATAGPKELHQTDEDGITVCPGISRFWNMEVQCTKKCLRVWMMECRHWFTLHLHAAGLCSCSRLIFFPNHTHQAKPITTHTTDST